VRVWANAVPRVSVRTAATAAACASLRQLTDLNGRFVFRECVAGAYTVSASRLGYAQGAYGRTRVGGPVSAVDLSNAQALDLGRIQLWRFGAFTGRILDDAGEPVAGITVRAFPV
jgi:hypothetical protein